MSTGPHIRAVWSDFAGVLTPPVSHDLEGFCRRAGLPADAFRRAMAAVAEPFGGDLMAPLDTPLLSEEEWAARMTVALRETSGVEADLTGFGERWFADRQTNTAWLEHLRRLRRAGVFVGLLSNMPPSWDPHWRRMLPPDGLFDRVVLSFQAGARKPEPGIFEVASQTAGVPPQECLLVDDLPANCAGAEQAGWQAIHFTDADEVAAQLMRRLPPGGDLLSAKSLQV